MVEEVDGFRCDLCGACFLADDDGCDCGAGSVDLEEITVYRCGNGCLHEDRRDADECNDSIG